jgi:hypothetical protein
MLLYVVRVHRLSHIRLLIKVHRVAPQVRIIHDAPQVALEMSVVHGIEAHQRRKEAPVGPRIAVAAKVTPGRNDFLPEIQHFEDLCYGLVVRHLPGGETGAVDAVVDGLVDRIYGRIDLVAQILGEETVVSAGERLELRSKSAFQLLRHLLPLSLPRVYLFVCDSEVKVSPNAAYA